ncbi:MAG TPA: NADH-quinone oxidoreductase subunit C [Coriobacteriia bacterium]|nr:NADH-quinone oxidoreductase subunit C [Coriobacteriia bacterium]
MQPDPTLIAKTLAEAGVEASFEEVRALGYVVRIAPESVRAAIGALKDCSRSFDFLVDLFGIDTGEAIDVVYHVRSFGDDAELHVKAEHAYDSVLTSVWDILPAALMAERECAEMFGLKLAGHPNPKHLLLTEGSQPLLRKSIEIRTAEEVRNR